MKKKATGKATVTKKTFKEKTGKTRVGTALTSIWGGISGIFTGKSPVQSSPDGTAVTVKDSQGNVLIQKPINNTNWQNILAGVGLAVGGIVGASTGETDPNITGTQDQEVLNEQNIRSGQNTLYFVIGGVLLFIGGIWAYFKFKD